MVFPYAFHKNGQPHLYLRALFSMLLFYNRHPQILQECFLRNQP